MGRTQLSTREIGSVQRNDIDTTTTTQALITKLIAGTGISISSTGVDAGTGDVTVNVSTPLQQLEGLGDPNVDRIIFWDDSASSYAYLTLGTNLSITGTTINASGGGITNAAGANVIPKSDGTNLVASLLTESGGNILLGASAKLGSSYQTGTIGFHADTTQNAIRFTPQGAGGSYFKVYEATSNEMVFQSVPTAGSGGLSRFDSYNAEMAIGISGANQIYIKGGAVGILHNSPTAAIDVKRNSGEQIRLRYDDSNYFSGIISSGGSFALDLVGTSPTFTFGKDVKVPDDAYDATNWNSNLAAPTKNAIRDKLESLRSIVLTVGNTTMGSVKGTDYIYIVQALHTMTLPTAAGNTNLYTLKNIHSANITINTTSSQTIDGATTLSLPPMASVTLVSDGTSLWFVI